MFVKSLASETRRKHPEVREVRRVTMLPSLVNPDGHCQAAEKSIALLKSSPDVTTNLASGVSRSFLSERATGGRMGTTNDAELSVGGYPLCLSRVFAVREVIQHKLTYFPGP